MMFEPLAEMLEENVEALKRGKTLFINQMPFEIQLGLLLKDSFAGTQIDEDIPDLRRGRFQLAARGKTPLEVKALIDEAVVYLTMTNVDLMGITVKVMRPLSEPIPYQFSVGNYVEYSVNFSYVYGIVRQ